MNRHGQACSCHSGQGHVAAAMAAMEMTGHMLGCAASARIIPSGEERERLLRLMCTALPRAAASIREQVPHG